MGIETLDSLNNYYNNYLEKKLINKRFKHSEILPLIEFHKSAKELNITLVGHSIEGREIFSIEYGKGQTIVLMWSQMHGDEPTATMALFDLINFLTLNDQLNQLRNEINENLKLIMIPMLNPDGAEKIIRYNALGIDLNRDARVLQSPESKILIDLVDKYQPDFAFNLHDQDFRWSVGSGNNLAAISLLAPVFDNTKTINNSRSRAIRLIADLRKDFELYLPGKIARYKDDFEPRSFGDTIAGKNSSTILIETGRDIYDPNKLFYRKITFLMLISAFSKIIDRTYEKFNYDEYFEIPSNGKFLYDLILRNVSVSHTHKPIVVDIAINREEDYELFSRNPKFVSCIMEIGDLSTTYGIEEFDCTGLTLSEGKITQDGLTKLSDLNIEKINNFLNNGILFLKKVDLENYSSRFTSFPINIIKEESNYIPGVEINKPANFNLTLDGKLVKQVINGWFCEPGKTERVTNGLIFY